MEEATHHEMGEKVGVLQANRWRPEKADVANQMDHDSRQQS